MSAIDFVKRYWRRKVDPIDLLMKVKSPNVEMQTLIHVGAHLGQERYQYEACGFRDILWIEGSPSVHHRLAAAINDHTNESGISQTGTRHRTYCALCADRDGDELSFHEFCNDGESSSIFSSTLNCQKRWPHVRETGKTEVLRSHTLDHIAEDHQLLDATDVLVVDVQGAELLVLQGAERLLVNVKAVVSEVSTVAYYEGGVLYPELREFLRIRGFQPMSAPRRHGDILFLKNELAE